MLSVSFQNEMKCLLCFAARQHFFLTFKVCLIILNVQETHASHKLLFFQTMSLIKYYRQLFDNAFQLIIFSKGIDYKISDSCLPNVYTTCSAWTGGNDLDSEGQYVWDHSNTTIGFSYWQPTEPSLGAPDKAAVRDCIDVLRNGKWNDRVCTHLKPFICERNA